MRYPGQRRERSAGSQLSTATLNGAAIRSRRSESFDSDSLASFCIGSGCPCRTASPTSESLQKGGEENLAALKKLSGAAFDKAYIDHEVAYHEAVISALDKTLIPSAQNAELKALLVKVRPAFVAHLDHAKQLQAELAKSGG